MSNILIPVGDKSIISKYISNGFGIDKLVKEKYTFYLSLKYNSTFSLNFSVKDIVEYYKKYQEYQERNLVLFDREIVDEIKNKVQLSHEIAGTIKSKCIFSNSNKNWELLHALEISKTGDSDSVDISYEKFTFHTHPKPTYSKKGTNIAWPSRDDYLGLIDIGKVRNEEVYHILFSVEGIYVMMYKKYRDGDEELVKNFMSVGYRFKSIDIFLELVNVDENLITKFYTYENVGFIEF